MQSARPCSAILTPCVLSPWRPPPCMAAGAGLLLNGLPAAQPASLQRNRHLCAFLPPSWTATSPSCAKGRPAAIFHRLSGDGSRRRPDRRIAWSHCPAQPKPPPDPGRHRSNRHSPAGQLPPGQGREASLHGLRLRCRWRMRRRRSRGSPGGRPTGPGARRRSGSCRCSRR